jgi:hypothetical protein
MKKKYIFSIYSKIKNNIYGNSKGNRVNYATHIKGTCASLATAFARRVFPTPAGP